MHGSDTCVRGAAPADVVDPHTVVGVNPLLALTPSAESAWGKTFGEHACLAYSDVAERRANAETESSANDHFIMNIIRLALEAACLQWMEIDK